MVKGYNTERKGAEKTESKQNNQGGGQMMKRSVVVVKVKVARKKVCVKFHPPSWQKQAVKCQKLV